MIRTTEVYELNPVTDDPRFEGFALMHAQSVLGRSSLDDDLTPGYADAETTPNWAQPSLALLWTPPRVEGRVAEFNDYPCLDLIIPTFSERAVCELKDLLAPHGELLPLTTTTKTKFFLFNILTISNVLDRAKSKCTFWSEPPTTATDIQHFEFDPRKLQGLSIFRIRELPSSVFVSNVFVDRVKSAGLQGFDFTQVWPLPLGISWRQQNKSVIDKRRALKQHTLVVMIPATGHSDELQQIKALEEVWDGRLHVDSISSNYLGCYEGHDAVDGYYRMFLSCPDADRLLSEIEQELANLNWRDEITVVRRYGPMYDEQARQKMSTI